MSPSPSKTVKIIYDNSTNDLQLLPPDNIFNLNPDELRKRLINLKRLEIVDLEPRSWAQSDWSDVASIDSDDSSDEKEGKPSNNESSSKSTQPENEPQPADSDHDSKSSSVEEKSSNNNQRSNPCKTSTTDERIHNNLNNLSVSKPEVFKMQESNKLCSDRVCSESATSEMSPKLGRQRKNKQVMKAPMAENSHRWNNEEQAKSEDVSYFNVISERLNDELTLSKESNYAPEKQKKSAPRQKKTNHDSRRLPKFSQEERVNTPRSWEESYDLKNGSISKMTPRSRYNNKKEASRSGWIHDDKFSREKMVNTPRGWEESHEFKNGSISEMTPRSKYNNKKEVSRSGWIDDDKFSREKRVNTPKPREESRDLKNGSIPEMTSKSKYYNKEEANRSPETDDDEFCCKFPGKKLPKQKKHNLKDFSDQKAGKIDRGSQCLSNLACVMLKERMNQECVQKKQEIGLYCKVCSLSELNYLDLLSHFNDSDHCARDNICVALNHYCSICKLIICCEEMDSAKEIEDHGTSILHTLIEKNLSKQAPIKKKGFKSSKVDHLVLKKFKCTLMEFQPSTNSKSFLVPYDSSEESNVKEEQIHDGKSGVKHLKNHNRVVNVENPLANIWVFPLKMNQESYHDQNWVKFIGGSDTHRLYEHLLPMLSNVGDVERCLIDEPSIAAYVLFKKRGDIQKLLKIHSESPHGPSLPLVQLVAMASKSELSLPLFDGSNYIRWSARLMLMLKLHKCSEVVQLDEKPSDVTAFEWARLDLRARNLILQGLANEQVKKIIAETSAKKMLLKLDACYIANMPNQILWKKHLLGLKMEESEHPLNFFNKFDKLINELLDAGEVINEVEKMKYLLSVIPRGLSSTVNLLDAVPSDQKNTDYIKAKIIAAYERKKDDMSSDLTSKLRSLNLGSRKFSNQKYWRGRGLSKFSLRSHESQSDFQGASSNFGQRNWRGDQTQSAGWRGDSFSRRRSQRRGSYRRYGGRRGRFRGYNQNRFQNQRGSFNARQNEEENSSHSGQPTANYADNGAYEEPGSSSQPKSDTSGKLVGGGNDCSSLLGNKQRFMEMITLSVNSITNELNSLEVEKKLISLKTSIAMAIECEYPECVVYEFGSRVSGLSSSNSDYDLFVDLTGRMYWGTPDGVNEEQSKIETIHHIEKIQEILKDHNEFTTIIAILTARVPILRFTHVPTDSPCDLSFRNGLCVENTKLISKYLRMNLKIRWVIIAVKYWANVCGLGSSANFTTYALTWMVLFYLMTKKLIPPVACLMNLKNPNQRLIQGWKFETVDYIGEATISETEDKLLQGFFGYYARFNYNNSIVCPRTGTVVKKKVIANCSSDQMPDGIKDYEQYVHQFCSKTSTISGDPDKFDITECCVQDPFLLSHNITRQVRPKILEKFRKYCDIANIEILLWSK